MSLSDKILEILKKKPVLNTAEIKAEVKNLGIDRSLRTIERHIERLLRENKIKTIGYDRKKKRPTYAITNEKTEAIASYQSLIDDPRIDWSKIPYEERYRICFAHQCYREGSISPEQYEATLLDYFPEYRKPEHDSLKPLKEKLKGVLTPKKK